MFADVNLSNAFGITPLTAACAKNNFEIVKYMMETCHAKVNISSNDGRTPLTVAYEKNSFETMKYLVETCQADVNLFNIFREHHLHLHVRIIVLKQ